MTPEITVVQITDKQVIDQLLVVQLIWIHFGSHLSQVVGVKKRLSEVRLLSVAAIKGNESYCRFLANALTKLLWSSKSSSSKPRNIACAKRGITKRR